MAIQHSHTQSSTADREIVFSRTFNAPRDLVYEAWTDPKHVQYWWGPNGFSNTFQKFDLRTGGEWEFTMHGPDGKDYPNHIQFEEVVKPERLVFRHGAMKDDPDGFHVTVTFEAEGNKTKLTMRSVFKNAEVLAEMKKFGAVEGGQQTLARLEKRLRRMSATQESGLDADRKKFRLVRILDAPRELVFNAWVDPKQMAKWWGPEGFTNPVCELDVRPGGAINIQMTGPDGIAYPMGGTFHEIVPPARLVFSAVAYDAEGAIFLEDLNTITFEDVKGKTKLTVEATIVRITPQGEGALSGMEEGWNQSLDRLAALHELEVEGHK